MKVLLLLGLLALAAPVVLSQDAKTIMLSAVWVSNVPVSPSSDLPYDFLLSVNDGDRELVKDKRFFTSRRRSYVVVEEPLMTFYSQESSTELQIKAETSDLFQTDRAEGVLDMLGPEASFGGGWVTLAKRSVIGSEVRLLLRCSSCAPPWDVDAVPPSVLLGIKELRLNTAADTVGAAEVEVRCAAYNGGRFSVRLAKVPGLKGVTYRASETHAGAELMTWRKEVNVFLCGIFDEDPGEDEGVGVGLLQYGDFVSSSFSSDNITVGKEFTSVTELTDASFITCLPEEVAPEYTCERISSASALEASLSVVLLVVLSIIYSIALWH